MTDAGSGLLAQAGTGRVTIRALAVGGWDQTVRFYDPVLGHQLAAFDWQLQKIRCLAIAPDGMTAAAGGDSPEVVVWDVEY